MEEIDSVRAVELNCTGSTIAKTAGCLLQAFAKVVVCDFRAGLEYLSRIARWKQYNCLPAYTFPGFTSGQTG